LKFSRLFYSVRVKFLHNPYLVQNLTPCINFFTDEDDAPVNKDDIIIAPATVGRMHAKLLQFGDNRRPAYWGTWRKQTKAVGPRRPFGKDESIFDYEIDSDDEWEEEVEPGESLTDSEGEGEEKEPADDYEV
jgi:chromatin assembly factor 1 subunit A